MASTAELSIQGSLHYRELARLRRLLHYALRQGNIRTASRVADQILRLMGI